MKPPFEMGAADRGMRLSSRVRRIRAELRLTTGLLLSAALLVEHVTSPRAYAQGLSPEKATVLRAVEAQRDEIKDLSMRLWSYAEPALKEVASAKLLTATLEAQGFKVVRGVAGLPTAFVASYGSGHPIVGILAEYDALPGLGNEVLPRQLARKDGNPNGHACGHNLFAAGSIAAAIAVKSAMEAHHLAGTIRLYGTPAEETIVGKVYMARAGLFDDLDAALDWHPESDTKVSNQPGQAMNNFEVEFFGRAAHAATEPWKGRSALDAAEMMNFGAELLREHVPPTARIHYVISNGGVVPNIVPAYAKVWYFVRDSAREQVEEHYQRLLNIAHGAALATGTEYKVSLITGVHERLLNRPLQEAMQANLELVGAPRFSSDDQSFAREIQKALGNPELGLDTLVKPLPAGPEPLEGGSTDAAEVSWITPEATAYVATMAAGMSSHTWAVTASSGTEGAFRGAEVAAKVLSLTAVDLLTDGRLLSAARAFFRERTGGRPYQSPLSPDQQPRLP